MNEEQQNVTSVKKSEDFFGKNLPIDVIIYHILSYYEYVAYSAYDLEIENQFGYFDFDKGKKYYKLWSSMKIHTSISDYVKHFDMKNYKNRYKLSMQPWRKEQIYSNQRGFRRHTYISPSSLVLLTQQWRKDKIDANLCCFIRHTYMAPSSLKYISCKLNQLTSLTLICCDYIRTIPQFLFLTSLSICNCNKIKIIPQFDQLIKLRLDDCVDIFSISPSDNLISLRISGCHKIFSIPQFNKLASLDIRDCDNIFSISPSDQLTFLRIFDCDNIQAIPQLDKLIYLIIRRCGGMKVIFKLDKLSLLCIRHSLGVRRNVWTNSADIQHLLPIDLFSADKFVRQDGLIHLRW